MNDTRKTESYTKEYYNEDKNVYLFPSSYCIGQRVLLELKEASTDNAYIRAVRFTEGKVRYSVFLSESKTTLHNVDSYFIPEGFDEFIDMSFDNYS